METTYESVRIIHLHDATSDGNGGEDQQTGLSLNKGDRGMFLFQNTGIQSWLEPIDSPLLNGLP